MTQFLDDTFQDILYLLLEQFSPKETACTCWAGINTNHNYYFCIVSLFKHVFIYKVLSALKYNKYVLDSTCAVAMCTMFTS